MSGSDKVEEIGAIQAVTSERLAHLYQTVSERIISAYLDNPQDLQGNESFTDNKLESEILTEHLASMLRQLAEQRSNGEHEVSFFRRFMRAANTTTNTAQIDPIEGKLPSKMLENTAGNLKSDALGTSGNILVLINKQLHEMSKLGSSPKALQQFVENIRHIQLGKKSNLLDCLAPDPEICWDLEPVYGLTRERRHERRWGSQFLLNTYDGSDPMDFDHETTFKPLEVEPPADSDFVSFDDYASTGIAVGWQCMQDNFIRYDTNIDRGNSDSMDVFLLDYEVISVVPTESISGAIAHTPSGEALQLLWEYINEHNHVKTCVRVELLNASGKTVAEVWVSLGVIRRSQKKPYKPRK